MKTISTRPEVSWQLRVAIFGDATESGVVFGQRPTTWYMFSPKTTPAPFGPIPPKSIHGQHLHGVQMDQSIHLFGAKDHRVRLVGFEAEDAQR